MYNHAVGPYFQKNHILIQFHLPSFRENLDHPIIEKNFEAEKLNGL